MESKVITLKSGRNIRRYAAFCTSCGCSRGWKDKNKLEAECNPCCNIRINKAKIGKKTPEKTRKKQREAAVARYGLTGSEQVIIEENSTLTQLIKGRMCYKDSCVTCGKDRGYVSRTRMSKNCQSCSNSKNKLGKPSPLKGIKTGRPAWNRGKYHGNPTKKILRNRMSRRMRHALNGKNLSKKWIHIFDMVGYSVEELKSHLESRFQVGMSWGNIGRWEIDHVCPESKFDYSSLNDDAFKKCWALSNLQPLWSEDNRRKSNKIEVCHS
jgi:hypothetical protein